MPWPSSTGMSSRRPWDTCQRGPFFSKKAWRFSVPGIEPSGKLPVAEPFDERLVDRGRQRVRGHRRGAQGQRPRRTDDAAGGQALRQVVPGDLGGERVEDRPAAQPQLLEGAEELVATAVAAADRAEPRVARPVLLDPGEPRHPADQGADVVALDVWVLDVRVAAGLAEAALVEGDHRVAGVEEPLELRGVGRPRAAPAVAVHEHRDLVAVLGACRPEDRVADLDRRRAARIGHAEQAAVLHLRLVGVRGPGRLALPSAVD